MEFFEFAEEVGRLAAIFLARPKAAVSAELSAALFRFSVASKDGDCFESAGEMARSLGCLLAHYEGQILDSQMRLQVVSILQSLLEVLGDDGLVGNSRSRSPLVAPISPSAQQINNRVVLYVDDGALLIMLRETLFQAGFTTTNVNSLDSLALLGEEDYPAAIVADLSLCHMNRNSGEALAEFRQRSDPPPHLFCVASSTDIPSRLEAVRLGATRFFSKPLDVRRLIAVLKGVTGQTPTPPFKALLIDDDQLSSEVCMATLNQAGVETLSVHDPLQAPYLINQFKPDVVVTDVYMPGCNGLELLAILRQDDALADTPVIFLSSDNDTRCRLEALHLGADEFMIKPFDPSLFVATVVARAKHARFLKRSRGECRNVLERMREMERRLQENSPGSHEAGFQMDNEFFSLISMEDYILHDDDGVLVAPMALAQGGVQ